MLHRPLRRAAALSLGALLAFAGTASADTLLGDADGVLPLNGSRFLGDVSPGGITSADVGFVLVCAGSQHVDADQSPVVSWSGAGIAPLDGAIVSVSTATLAPLTTAWAPDAQGCPSPVPAQPGGAFSHVVLRAPTKAGLHTFTVAWDRSLEPAGSNDANAFSRTMTSIDLTLRVPNTPPTLTVPTSAEGNTTGGWIVDWSSVSATDPDDDPDPTPTCTPAAGAFLPLGSTEVTCSVTDSLGASVTKVFDMTVEDTTAPTMTGVPDDLAVTTSDPTGRAVTFADPSATDVVDPSPTVSCSPASGSIFAVGTTTVLCTATDGSGNVSGASFDVTVDFVAPPDAPPTLTVPASLTKEGNTTGGWIADWSGVSATDPEDDPDPTPTCTPAAGAVVPLGTTEVTCSVTDSAGASETKSFNVTVEDTTAPALDVPGDISVSTSDPTGRAVTFADPSATDVVDPSPDVRCSHASGDHFDVGTTHVTCTATDDSGNPKTASFDVIVVFEAPPPTEPPPPTHAASATWLEPVAGGGTTFEAHRGRTLPVKVRLFVDGDERTSGDAGLALTPCGGGTAMGLDLDWSGGRWNHSLDTSMLSGDCYDVRATIDDLSAGSFRLILRGDETAKASTKPATKPAATKTSR